MKQSFANQLFESEFFFFFNKSDSRIYILNWGLIEFYTDDLKVQ